MRLIVQRVSEASVEINGAIKSAIINGLLVFVGIEDQDNDEDIEWLCGKITRLRIFDDEDGVMNHSIADFKGEFLVISQFTLHAMVRKGNRPSYIRAAKPEFAIPMYEKFLKKLSDESGLKVLSGEFGADMKVSLINVGPVTIFIDSKNRE